MANTEIKIKRHCQRLSAKEVDEVVDIAADLIVRYLKGHAKSAEVGPQERQAEK